MQQLFTQQNFAFSKLLAFRIQIVLAYQIMAVAVGWRLGRLALLGLAELRSAWRGWCSDFLAKAAGGASKSRAVSRLETGQKKAFRAWRLGGGGFTKGMRAV